jgi:hypothetical protein
MRRIVFESWLLLFRFERMVRFREFEELYRVVRGERTLPVASTPISSKEDLCRAMDYACVFYFKTVLCLQRSAATTLLLRRHGWSADLVIGAQLLPFRSHAWCEVNRLVVNDRPHMPDTYQVLERC